MKPFFNSVGSRPYSKNQREPTDFGLEAENPVPFNSMVPDHREPSGSNGNHRNFRQVFATHPGASFPPDAMQCSLKGTQTEALGWGCSPRSKARTPAKEDFAMSITRVINNRASDVEAWLRAVLRKDTVPLVSITTRARLEGVDIRELWQVIRDIAIQVEGMGSQRYVKLPHTVWHGRNPTPARDQGRGDTNAIDAAVASLRLAGDDRIVCPACRNCAGPRCPGGAPTPDLQPTRCNHFKTNQE